MGGASFGKGSTAEQGEASALMESIERYSGIFQGDEIRTTRRFTDFPPGDAILPNDVLLFSDAQYRRGVAPVVDAHDVHADRAAIQPIGRNRMVAGLVAARQTFQISADQPPLFSYTRDSVAFLADSNGCAAGNTREEAIVQGFLELVERDAYAIWWYNRLRRPAVDLSQFDDAYVRELHKPPDRARTPAVGARHHQRSRHSELRGGDALDTGREGKYRIRFRLALRCRASPCCGHSRS